MMNGLNINGVFSIFNQLRFKHFLEDESQYKLPRLLRFKKKVKGDGNGN